MKAAPRLEPAAASSDAPEGDLELTAPRQPSPRVAVQRPRPGLFAWASLAVNAGPWVLVVGGFFAVVGLWRFEGWQRDYWKSRSAGVTSQLREARAENALLLARTAVTLLEVTPDRVSLILARADGTVESLATPFAPDREIFVDYVVHQGRVLIRRVYDDRTAPGEGVVLNPLLVWVDWETLDVASFGTVIYRRLSPGMWAVSLSGAGALTLAPATARDLPELLPMLDAAPRGAAARR